ncbi:sigma-54-dependent transcriptional regulator [Sediminibacterium soli]|uniref:sigma-54-dependent transcriptional regulator n=1 Tax=Sediminibacterium soli TaxID=2698829 RepID=UPI00137A6A49|nr:sigma-54 dependent transcriptional regulator [Sediminibacterium soli]NCI46744.1 sigma-54-dependent Fis family transcriptional regulator [Sediminibacterium soli]
MSASVLIIDDEDALRKLLSRIIGLEGFTVEEAASIKAGLSVLGRRQVDVVLCDVKLPDGNGVDFVKQLKAAYPVIECILLTAYGNIGDGVQAIKNGAFDYITKGNDNDRIIPLLHQAVTRVSGNRIKAVSIREKSGYDFDNIIGNSPVIHEAMQLAKKIALSDAAVLLLGETGTGKEVFAGAIHSGSKRAGHSFIAINCSAFTKDLLEGELFGHKAGAYTGASKDKKGLIQLADKGTLFLDEIGELPLELQAKLLRVLENGEFIRLGDEKTTLVDIRIVAATNRDLEADIRNGHFREDLFYRLNVFSLTLPPLRARPDDIVALSDHFLKKYALKENQPILKLNAGALQLLKQHQWKGNIRELKNVLERAVILTEGEEITPAQLPYDIQRQGNAGQHHLSLAAVEKMHIRRVLQITNGNKTKTAELLGIGLTTLYRKIEEYDIR